MIGILNAIQVTMIMINENETKPANQPDKDFKVLCCFPNNGKKIKM